jgi:DNA-binding transcriptional LysR family regulator
MTIDRIEALLAVAEHGTTGRAATALRVTQSAVSKRIAALEDDMGCALVERDGRNIRLTAHGEQLCRRARGPLADLKAALRLDGAARAATMSVGVSESILASWGADVLARAARRVAGLRLELHAHRSPLALDHVRAGDYHLALVAGESDAAPELRFEPLVEEELVVVPARGRSRAVRETATLPVLTIEPGAATWRTVARRLGHLRRDGGVEIVVESTVESFAAAVQMARAGLGHALVPIGIARALGVRRPVRLPEPGLRRSVSLAARPTTLERAIVRELVDALAVVTNSGGIDHL